MEQINNESLRGKRIEVYIFNKERIKALERVMTGKKLLKTFKYGIGPDNPLYQSDNFAFLETWTTNSSNNVSFTFDEKYHVYNPHLAAILTTKEVEVLNLDTQKNEIINGQSLILIFKTGFDEGEAFFNNEYPNARSIFYTDKEEQFLQDLKDNYHHKGKKYSKGKGWNWVKASTPFIFRDKEIKEFGYYSGIISTLYELIIGREPIFNKCDFFKVNKSSNANDEVKFNYLQELEQIKKCDNQFWKGITMKNVVEHFEPLTTRKNKEGEYFLTEEQFVTFLKRGFLADDSQPKIPINFSSGQKGLIGNCFYQFFDLAVRSGHVNQKANFRKLMLDTLEGWDESSIRNVLRTNRTKKKW